MLGSRLAPLAVCIVSMACIVYLYTNAVNCSSCAVPVRLLFTLLMNTQLQLTYEHISLHDGD